MSPMRSNIMNFRRLAWAIIYWNHWRRHTHQLLQILMHRLAFDNFRQVKLKNFPYLVIYSIEGEEIIVAKVFNTYQNPLKKIR